MPRFTELWLADQRAKEAARRSPEGTRAAVPAGSDDESELHRSILRECKARGWIALHGDMTRRTGRTLGEPDIIVLASGGRVFLVECKTRTGRRSPDQIALAVLAEQLGHTVHLVRSFAEFLDVIRIS